MQMKGGGLAVCVVVVVGGSGTDCLKPEGTEAGETNKRQKVQTENSECDLEEPRVNIYVPSLARQW